MENKKAENTNDMANKPAAEKKDNANFRHGAYSLAFTAIFIVAVILINIIVSSLVDRYNLNVDMTTDQVYSISDQTKDILKGLNKDVEITVLMEEDVLRSLSDAKAQYGSYLYQTFKSYETGSDRVKVTFINSERNPEIINHFNSMYGGDISQNVAVVVSGDKIKPVSQSQLMNYAQYSESDYRITSEAEKYLTSAIVAVTDDSPIKVKLVTTDQSISYITGFTETLEINGYDVEEVDLTSGEIGEDTDMVILNAPLTDLPQTSVDKITKFLENDGKYGKNLFYVVSYQQKETPNIDKLLADYGLEVGGRVLDVDQTKFYQTNDGAYGMYADSTDTVDYGKLVANKELPIFLYVPTNINLLYDEKDSRETKALLETSATCIEIPRNNTEELDPNTMERKVRNAMAAGSKYTFDENGNKVASTIIALGTQSIINPNYTQEASLGNGDYGMSVVNTICGKETTLSIVSKDLTANTLSVSGAQGLVILLVTLIVIPAVILIFSLVKWIRRRKM